MATEKSKTSSGKDIKTSILSQCSIPPPRSLAEFIIYPKRWKVPDFKNCQKLTDQVKKNLLYFQTNYFIMSAIFCAIVMFASMKSLLTGIISTAVVSVSVLFFFDYVPQAQAIKRDHPTCVIVLGLTFCFVLWHALSSILAVIAIVIAPIPLWLLHAVFRCSENLLDSTMKNDFFKSTPMGLILRLLGVDINIR